MATKDKNKTTVTDPENTENAKKPRASTTKSVKKKATPKKRGRKEWVPDYELIEKYASHLMTDKQIADACGINHSVFCRKKSQLNQLQEVLNKGRAKTIARCANVMLMTALDQKNPDLPTLRFILERKAGWKQQIDVNPKDFANMTTEELLALRDELQNS